MKNDNVHMTTCDSFNGFLVTSGSALLELEPGDTVSLVPVLFNTLVLTQTSVANIFTGFLIFPTV